VSLLHHGHPVDMRKLVFLGRGALIMALDRFVPRSLPQVLPQSCNFSITALANMPPADAGIRSQSAAEV